MHSCRFRIFALAPYGECVEIVCGNWLVGRKNGFFDYGTWTALVL